MSSWNDEAEKQAEAADMVNTNTRASAGSSRFKLATALLTLTVIPSPAWADDTAEAVGRDAAKLEAEFQDPPAEARPRVWWHWINGNITAEGLRKDLAWMKRVGIGGAQAFDVNLQSPQIVDERLVYMTPPWKAAFKVAAQEADRLGLELAVASSPGWSETGGPWVPPEDGMKKLVWSEVLVTGGKAAGAVPQPPAATGPFQSIAAKSGTSSTINEKAPEVPAPFYRDVAVLAFPATADLTARPRITTGTGQVLDGAALFDADLETALDLPKVKNATALHADYPRPQTIRSATLFVAESAGKFVGANLKARLEAQVSSDSWQPVAEIPLSRVPTTVAFAPVTARAFRVTFEEVSNLPKITPPPPGVDLFSLATGFSPGQPVKTIRVARFALSGHDAVDRAETKAGFDIVPDYFALERGLPDSAGIEPDKVLDLTDRLSPDGRLNWTPPKGTWRILRLGYSLVGTMNHPAPLEATGLEVDKYDGDAVRRYMDRYIATYRDTVGPELIGARGVKAILTDSIEVGSANWTPRMMERFRQLRGYDPLPWLPALTGTIVGSRSRSERFLFDFRRTLADLLASEHYAVVAGQAHANGLAVYGEALEDERPLLGDDMAMRKFADIPMAAMWSFGRAEGPKPTYLADMKGAASVAHLYGKPHVAAESLTSMLAPWTFAPADLKRMIDLEFATGINRPIIHTSVHVPVEDKKPGLRLSIFGQDFNRNEAWAELARPWMDYIARNALMLQQGKDVADIAYFHGEEAPLTALFGEAPVSGIPPGHAFDFVNADALLETLSNDGTDLVSRGGARYRLLYLGGSSSRMSLKVLRRVAELVEGGATLVGLRPEADPGLELDRAQYDALRSKLWPGSSIAQVGKGRVVAGADLGAALEQLGVAPDFAFAGGQPDTRIPWVHRRLDDGETYFLSNQNARSETIQASFRVTGKAPELWHAETGRSEPVDFSIRDGVTTVPLTLGPDESVHIVFRKTAQVADFVAPAKPDKVLATVDGPWSLSFEPGRGAPAQVSRPELKPLNEDVDPSIRHFSGIASYAAAFVAPPGWRPGQPLTLDLGEAREIAEVTVNGKPAGFAWHAPYRVDVSKLVKPGKNRLEVRVANLWVNRLIGDVQPGATKVAWTATPTYRKDAPLRRSGLIGPVTLVGAEGTSSKKQASPGR